MISSNFMRYGMSSVHSNGFDVRVINLMNPVDNAMSTEGEVISFLLLFLATCDSDVTISAVLTNQNTVYMPFPRNTAFVYM